MSAHTIELCQSRLQKYLDAEEAVLLNQSYEIAGRRLVRADLEQIREGIKYWQGEIETIGSSAAPRVKYLRFGF